MNRIEQILGDARRNKRGAIMPFVCGGSPAPGYTAKVLPALSQAGAAVIEVGIPFSDPIADGPVIAAAMHEALKRGATPRSVLVEVAQARGATQSGVVAMVSYSIVERMGPGAFIKECAASGIDGLIFPDLPIEEADWPLMAARDAGLIAALLIAPTTPADRAERIARACTGFVYVIARAGITGERAALDEQALAGRVQRLRSVTDLPIACGFGISTPEQARAVVAHADAAIVGSALVRRMTETAARDGDSVLAAAEFTRSLVAGIR